MLKHRLLTAFILGPLVLWGIYALPELYFLLFVLLLVTMGAWEWSAFAGWNHKSSRSIFTALSAALYSSILWFNHIEINQAVILISLVWWLLCIPLLISFPFKQSHLLQKKLIKAIVGILLLLATLISMVMIRNNPNYGSEYILYLIFIIWFADSGAYFAGRSLGKNKLIPNVSPGKTWEGVVGAIVVTFIVSIASLYILDIPSSDSILFIIVTFVTVVYSIVGDLSESMFKRMENIKDSGNILPGHGGILDRIDSMMSAFPIFFAGLWLMEKAG